MATTISIESRSEAQEIDFKCLLPNLCYFINEHYRPGMSCDIERNLIAELVNSDASNFVYTYIFSKAAGLSNEKYAALIDYLKQYGGFCDSEIVMNVANYFDLSCKKPLENDGAEKIVILDFDNRAITSIESDVMDSAKADFLDVQYSVYEIHPLLGETNAFWASYHFSSNGVFRHWSTSEI